jgi:hypothetical protein
VGGALPDEDGVHPGASEDGTPASAGPTASAPGGRDRGRLRVAAAVVGFLSLAALTAVRVSGNETTGGDRGATASPSTTTGADPIAEEERTRALPADLGGISFTDVTSEAGLDAAHATIELDSDMAMTGGVAVADIEGDGDADLYLTRVGRPNALYRNDGDGTYTDIAAQAGVDRIPPDGGYQGSGAAAFADIDGDGCLDLYVAGAGDGDHPGEGALFVNDCQGAFIEETEARGASLPATTANLGAQGHGVTFADPDHDGDLDLLVLHWDPAFLGGEAAAAAYQDHPGAEELCARTAATRALGADRSPVAGPNRSRLLRNDGTGNFTDVTAEMGLPLDGIAAFTGDFVDIDGDGWEDLLIAGDFCTSALFRNDQGTGFTDITAEAGVGTDENAMGSVVRDVNGDGLPDWFVTAIEGRTESGGCPADFGNTGCSGNRLYLNDGGGRFVDATDDVGVRDGWWGWGAAIEDLGNDGRLSFVQGNGYLAPDPPRDRYADDPMRLWMPSATDPSERVEVAAMAGLIRRDIETALVTFDHDGDGDLDILVSGFGTGATLYRNDTPTDRHHVTIRLDDPSRPGNRIGVGSRVRVTSAGGSVTGWISTGGSYESQRLPELHVGLGDDPTPVTVEVWWPGDPEPQIASDVGVDRVVTIVRS